MVETALLCGSYILAMIARIYLLFLSILEVIARMYKSFIYAGLYILAIF